MPVQHDDRAGVATSLRLVTRRFYEDAMTEMHTVKDANGTKASATGCVAREFFLCQHAFCFIPGDVISRRSVLESVCSGDESRGTVRRLVYKKHTFVRIWPDTSMCSILSQGTELGERLQRALAEPVEATPVFSTSSKNGVINSLR